MIAIRQRGQQKRGRHTADGEFEVIQEFLRLFKKARENYGDFLFNEIPLELELHAHLPDDLRVPVLGISFRRLVVAIVVAPRSILGCGGMISCRV